MDIDCNGVWTNENDPETIAVALRLATEHPAPSLAIPARIPDLSGNERRDKVFFSDVRPSDRLIPDEADRTRRTSRHPRAPRPARRFRPARREPSQPLPQEHPAPLPRPPARP